MKNKNSTSTPLMPHFASLIAHGSMEIQLHAGLRAICDLQKGIDQNTVMKMTGLTANELAKIRH